MRCIGASFIALCLVAGSVHAQRSAQRIEDASFITIGGIEQWVTIRGDDRRNPVLLLLHGGPGDVQSPFVSTYAPYEKDFILVQWDQRGAGRTFATNGAAGVTREKLLADGIDLAEQLHKRFPRAPLILFGHSWGSIIATGMAQQRPELFVAYVGTGQVTAWADTVQFQFDFLKQRYKDKGDTAALAALDAIDKPDPKNVDQYFGFSRPIRQNMNASDTAWLTGLRNSYSANGETEAALKAIGDGMSASGPALIGASMATDLPATATSFKIPYYVIQGRHDLFAPTPLVEAYFNKVSAPKKRLIIIEDAGHFALATHQAEVIAALKAVIPLSGSSMCGLCTPASLPAAASAKRAAPYVFRQRKSKSSWLSRLYRSVGSRTSMFAADGEWNHVQNRRNARRCQVMTVSGSTIITADRHGVFNEAQRHQSPALCRKLV